MANPIKNVVANIAQFLTDKHETLFGYVPDPTDASKPNKIYYPSRPESPMAKDYLAIEITRYGLAPQVGQEATIELTIKWRTDLTEREWTDGGHDDWVDLSYEVTRLINAAAWRYKTFAVVTSDYETVPNEAEPTEVGFNLSVVISALVGAL